MAELRFTFDAKAFAIECMINEGRKADALTAICEQLRAGASLSVQKLAADFLLPSARKKGRPKTNPKHWLEIGDKFNLMLDDGKTWETILVHLSAKYGYSESQIRRAKKVYDEATRRHDEAVREFTAE